MFDTDNLTTIFCQQNVPTETAMRNGAEVTSGSPPKPVNNTLKITELLCYVGNQNGLINVVRLAANLKTTKAQVSIVLFCLDLEITFCFRIIQRKMVLAFEKKIAQKYV